MTDTGAAFADCSALNDDDIAQWRRGPTQGPHGGVWIKLTGASRRGIRARDWRFDGKTMVLAAPARARHDIHRGCRPTIAIDAASRSGKVSPLFYGLMTEEINHAYDGGLYAELLRNRAFLDDARSPAHWSVVQGSGSAATIALDPTAPLNPVIGTSLRLDVTQASDGHAARVANRRLLGHPVRPASLSRLLLRQTAPGFDGSITGSLQSDDNARRCRRGQGHRSDRGLDALRVDAEHRQRADHRQGAIRPDLNRPGKVWVSLVSCSRRPSGDQRTVSSRTSCKCSWT
jgi:hypothetical protein